MISLFFANAIGWLTHHWRLVAACFGGLFLILVIGIVFNRCGDSTPAIDEEKIQQRQDEIDKRESEKLTNTLQKSNEVLANTINSAKQAEANTKQATNKDYSNATPDNNARCRAYPKSKGCL